MDVALGTSDLVYYPIVPLKVPPKKEKNAPTYGIVVEISRNAMETVPLVTIRSPVQVNVNVVAYILYV